MAFIVVLYYMQRCYRLANQQRENIMHICYNQINIEREELGIKESEWPTGGTTTLSFNFQFSTMHYLLSFL